ncbi:MAG TPA: hypothetical protein DDY32_06530 [Desulfobulbaceae bacterium]|nr:hypothetical protein [Desulfobulbaceae bacterium]
MATVSFRIDSKLAEQAEREARIENRSKAKQLEYWAKLGRAISSKLNLADAIAVTQGVKEIRLEFPQPLQSNPMNTDDIFNDLESDRKKGTLSQKVTSARIYYEASLCREGYLDKVDSVTGKRETGQFEDGEFRPLR